MLLNVDGNMQMVIKLFVNTYQSIMDLKFNLLNIILITRDFSTKVPTPNNIYLNLKLIFHGQISLFLLLNEQKMTSFPF